jgi:hypothetical protein
MRPTHKRRVDYVMVRPVPLAVDVGGSMNVHARTLMREWTVLAAVFGVLFASDARLTHLTSCIFVKALPTLRLDCAPGELCCSTDTSDASLADKTCFDLGMCGCCSHSPPRHSSEPDMRMASEPVPLKVVSGLEPASFAMLINPAASLHPARFLTAGPDANAPVVLLCNHLRF